MAPESIRSWGSQAALVGIMLLAVAARAELLLGGPYAPGADYGHTLLFTEEIRRLGDIPSTFPFHQLGLTQFLSSPGLPLEFLALQTATDLPDLRLTAFALVFSGVGVFGMYFLGKEMASRQLGLLAALIYAVLPANLEMLGWAGYANVYALALTPFLWWAVARARKRFDHRFVWLAALLAGAVFLTHLLTALVIAAATFIAALIDVALSQTRKKALTVYLYLAGASVLLGLPALVLVARTYLAGDDSLGFWSLDVVSVTRPETEDYLRFFSALGLTLAIVGMAVIVTTRLRGSVAVWLVMSLLAVAGLIAYSWVLGVSFYYERALYFATLPLSIMAAYALWSIRWPVGRLALVAGVIGTMSVGAVHTARSAADYYSVLNDDSLSAMEWLKEQISPDDIVVSDGCLAFLWEFIGRRPTAAAFAPVQLSSAKEERIAADARRILQNRAAAPRLLESYDVQYVLYDSACPSLNPNLVLENLNQQSDLALATSFGSVYVYKALE